MKSTTLVGREDAIEVFKLFFKRKPGEPLPILTFTAAPGGGRTTLIEHLFSKYCHPSKGHDFCPCVRIDFSKLESPKSILDILVALRDTLARSKDSNDNHLIFPRFDLGLIFALAAMKPIDGSRPNLTQMQQKVIDGLSILGDFGEIANAAGNIGSLLGFVPLIGVLVKRAERLEFPQELIQKLKNGSSWDWYREKLNLQDDDSNSTVLQSVQDDITITSLFTRLFDMSTDASEREKLIEQILPEALLEDIRSILNSDIPNAWDKATNVVLFFDGFEVLWDGQKNTGKALLEMLTPHRSAGNYDPLLLVIGSKKRLFTRAVGADSNFEPPTYTTSAKIRAEQMYRDWYGKVKSDQRLRLQQKYLEIWLHDFSKSEVRTYLSQHYDAQNPNTSTFKKQLQTIYRISHGHPLALSCLASSLEETTTEKDIETSILEEDLLKKLLDGLSLEEQRQLRRCAVPRTLGVNTIEDVLQPFASNLFTTDAEILWRHYRQITMFRAKDDYRLMLHPVIRYLLLQDLHPSSDPRRDYYKIHTSLIQHYRSEPFLNSQIEEIYHTLALGNYEDAVRVVKSLQANNALQWPPLLEAVEQAPNILADREVEPRADNALENARQENTAYSVLDAIILYTYLLSGSDENKTAALEHKLGLSYTLLSQQSSQEQQAHQEQAILHYQKALEFYLFETVPQEHARLNTELGDIYFHLLRQSQSEQHSDFRDKARKCYTEALITYSNLALDEETKNIVTKLEELAKWKTASMQSSKADTGHQMSTLDVLATVRQSPFVDTAQSTPSREEQPNPSWRRTSTTKKRRTPSRVVIVAVAITLIAVLILGLVSLRVLSRPSSTTNTATSLSNTPLIIPQSIKDAKGIGVFRAPNREVVGISDGRFAFDTSNDRKDKSIKSQLPDVFKTDDKGQKTSVLQNAVDVDSSDAEAKIYLEDQNVLNSGLQYITVVIAVTFQAPYPHAISRSTLQGAYIAQHEYNLRMNHVGGVLLRLLIARSGSDPKYVTGISQQIVLATQDDTQHIVGVVGWQSSASVYNQLAVLGEAHIPMISPSAGADDLHNKLYFFRVAPPNIVEASASAKYASSVLHAKRVALVVDNQEPYSTSFAKDFSQSFTDADHTICPVRYSTRHTNELQSTINQVLACKPDLIEFAISDTNDIKQALALLPTSGKWANISLLTGDSAYGLTTTPGQTKGFARLYFASLAYPDEWGYLSLSNPAFFNEYIQAFSDNDPSHVYGYKRPDNIAMLSYDAMSVLVYGYEIAVKRENGKGFSREDFQQALVEIKNEQAFQGVTGQISFGNDHDPMKKVTLILHATDEGIKIVSEQGCFLKETC